MSESKVIEEEVLKHLQVTKIEEDAGSETDQPTGLVGDEGGVTPGDTDAVTGNEVTQSSAERKARKSLAKLGLKKVEGVTRVTMKRARGQYIIIAHADVYKSPTSDCYIVFGEARAAEDSTGALANLQSSMGAASQFAQAEQAEQLAALAAARKAVASKNDVDEDDGGDLDESGIDADDIVTVMSQVKCSRAKAVRALRNADGDLINAIMNAS